MKRKFRPVGSPPLPMCSTIGIRTRSWSRSPWRAIRALPITKAKAGDLPARLLHIAAETKNPSELRLERTGRRARRLVQSRGEPLRVLALQARPRPAGGEPDDCRRCAGAGEADSRAASPPGRCAARRRTGRSRPPAGGLRAIDRRGAGLEADRGARRVGGSCELASRRAQGSPGEIRPGRSKASPRRSTPVSTSTRPSRRRGWSSS